MKRLAMVASLLLLGVSVVFVSFVYLASSHISERATWQTDQFASMGGFSPPGSAGNGQLSPETNIKNIGWIVVDYQRRDSGGVLKTIKECRFAVRPNPAEDFDFFHYKNEWYKLRGGELTLMDHGLSISPKFKRNLRFIETPSYFRVRNPFFLYRVHIAWLKLTTPAMSPLEYLYFLRANVPSCADIPLETVAPSTTDPRKAERSL